MTLAGIGDPLARDLKGLPGITAEMIRQEAELVTRRNGVANKPPVIAANIRTRAAAEQARKRQAAEAEARKRQEHAERCMQEASAYNAAVTAQQTIEEISDEELAASWERVAATQKLAFHVNRWRRQIRDGGIRAAASQNRGLRTELLRHAHPLAECNAR